MATDVSGTAYFVVGGFFFKYIPIIIVTDGTGKLCTLN